MLSNEFVALELTKARQKELMQEREHDRLLAFVIREYKSRKRENVPQERKQK